MITDVGFKAQTYKDLVINIIGLVTGKKNPADGMTILLSSVASEKIMEKGHDRASVIQFRNRKTGQFDQ